MHVCDYIKKCSNLKLNSVKRIKYMQKVKKVAASEGFNTFMEVEIRGMEKKLTLLI